MRRLETLASISIVILVWQDIAVAQDGPGRAAHEREAQRRASREAAEREAKTRAAEMSQRRAGDTAYWAKEVKDMDASQLRRASEAGLARSGARDVRSLPAGTNVAPSATPLRPRSDGSPPTKAKSPGR